MKPTTRTTPTAGTSTRSKNGAETELRVELMLYAGSNLGKARRVFERATQASAAHPVHHSPADAGAGRVAAA
jgi:hypothetical protein